MKEISCRVCCFMNWQYGAGIRKKHDIPICVSRRETDENLWCVAIWHCYSNIHLTLCLFNRFWSWGYESRLMHDIHSIHQGAKQMRMYAWVSFTTHVSRGMAKWHCLLNESNKGFTNVEKNWHPLSFQQILIIGMQIPLYIPQIFFDHPPPSHGLLNAVEKKSHLLNFNRLSYMKPGIHSLNSLWSSFTLPWASKW